MRVKLWTVFFVILAILCLYGCEEKERSQDEMVLNPGPVNRNNLTCEVSRHFYNM